MAKRAKKKTPVAKRTVAAEYDTVLSEMVELLERARRAAARAVNSVMTATYWEIGRRIVKYEQGGEARAEYGKELVVRLGNDLTRHFGRGFGWRNLFQMRSFYLAYPDILQTVSAKSDLTKVTSHFPLPWSHYVKLLSIEKPEARRFYEAEALRGGWSVRQLTRQINTLFYERTLLSRDKAAMLTKGARPRPEDLVAPEEEIKDPLVLEFLGLKDEYSVDHESEILEAHQAPLRSHEFIRCACQERALKTERINS
jgi:hypothetical protein